VILCFPSSQPAQSIKKIAATTSDPSKPDRYKLCLSDGVHKQASAMLATQLNVLVTDGSIVTNGVVKLDRYICSTVSGRRIIIVLGATVLYGDVGHEIGSPKKLDSDGPAGDTAGAAAAPAPAPAAAAPRDVKPNTSSSSSAAPAAPAGGGSNPYLKRKDPPQTSPTGGGGGGMGNVMPIAALNPYQSR
jgi:hypothetical protein